MAEPQNLIEQQDLAKRGGAPEREGDLDGNGRQPQPLGGVWTRSLDGWNVDKRWLQGIQLNPDRVLALAEVSHADLTLYELLLDDDIAMSAFQQRRLDVISRPWIVEPGADDAPSKAAADHLREQLNTIRWDDVCDKMLFARWFGYAVGEVIWEIGADGLLRIGDIYVPDRRWFGFRHDGTLVLRNPEKGGEGEEIPDRKFWIARGGAHHDALHYGIGLAHWCYWPIYFKKNAIKFWSLFLEKFGMPTLIGKFPPGWEQDHDKINALLAALSAVGTDSAVAVPADAEVDTLEATRSGSGASSYHEFVSLMDTALTRVILSQTMTSGQSKSSGMGSEQAIVQERKGIAISQADSDVLHEDFNDGPAKWLTEWNFPGAKPPRVYRKLTDDEDLDLIVKRDAELFAMGWQRTDESMKETYGEGFERKPQPAMVPDQLPFGQAGNDNQPPQLRARNRAQMAFAAQFASVDEPRPLYIHRQLLNSDALVRWARAQGFTNLQPAAELHVTQLYCRKPVDWFALASRSWWSAPGEVEVIGGPRSVMPLGPQGVIVLRFTSQELDGRFRSLTNSGDYPSPVGDNGPDDLAVAEHSFPEFVAHVTFAVDAAGVPDLAAVEPFQGDLHFGPEIWEPLDDPLVLNVPAVQFAAEQLDAVDRIVAAMAKDGTAAITAMVAPIRDAVAGLGANADPEALRFALLEAIEKMPTDQFARSLENPLVAVRAAELAGLSADAVA